MGGYPPINLVFLVPHANFFLAATLVWNNFFQLRTFNVLTVRCQRIARPIQGFAMIEFFQLLRTLAARYKHILTGPENVGAQGQMPAVILPKKSRTLVFKSKLPRQLTWTILMTERQTQATTGLGNEIFHALVTYIRFSLK
jgi:hypothetical protein